MGPFSEASHGFSLLCFGFSLAAGCSRPIVGLIIVNPCKYQKETEGARGVRVEQRTVEFGDHFLTLPLS